MELSQVRIDQVAEHIKSNLKQRDLDYDRKYNGGTSGHNLDDAFSYGVEHGYACALDEILDIVKDAIE